MRLAEALLEVGKQRKALARQQARLGELKTLSLAAEDSDRQAKVAEAKKQAEQVLEDMQTTIMRLRDLHMKINVANATNYVRIDGVEYSIASALSIAKTLRRGAQAFSSSSERFGLFDRGGAVTGIIQETIVSADRLADLVQDYENSAQQLSAAIDAASWSVEI